MTFRKTVATSVAALCLITSTQVPSASAATVSYQDKYCSVAITQGEVHYLLPEDNQSWFDDDYFKEAINDELKKLTAAVTAIKGLLANKETQTETREYLTQLDKAAADPKVTFDSTPSTKELFAKLPDDLFTEDNDPTKDFDKSITWKTRAQSALHTYGSDTISATVLTAMIKKLQQNDLTPLHEILGKELLTEEQWNAPWETVNVSEMTSPPDIPDWYKITEACKQLAKIGSGKKEVPLAPSYDEYVSTTAKANADGMIKLYQPLFDAIAASKYELGSKLDLATLTPTPEKISPNSKSTGDKADPEKSGFNWKLLLIIVAVLGAVGAAAAATMMPKPPVA